ncbi:ATP-binding cassette sub-family G member 4 isoform X2 [Cimex lectularius]|nr:ATP-binding cassette sub-family G member 4 isoform X2 [Cimex lectularius]
MEVKVSKMNKLLAKRAPMDIEFNDLTYTIPLGKNASKMILRGVSGYFKSGELTAILGPSGAGKSTLLNVLAGYRSEDGGGQIMVNGHPRDLNIFRKISRYIMQEDCHQKGLTVFESVMISTDLKLGTKFSQDQKQHMALEIMELLRLTKCKDTLTTKLSGGEKKRLSIAVELVDNPPVLFLDEPTTGLDDLSSSQCISLLKSLAQGGRTVICSIHTPSAKLFALFDNVYIVAEGQCVFQGLGEDIVPFLAIQGLHCPTHFNPADFILEVSSGEYGYYVDKMSAAVENGRCRRWNRKNSIEQFNREMSDAELQQLKKSADYGCSTWAQFLIIISRMFLQFWRNMSYQLLIIFMHVLIGLVIGGLFYNFGNDASKTLFNFGFCYVSMIVFMYTPMLPALVWFPMEVQLIKREHFNRWYNLNSYFMAITLSRLPMQLMCSFIYVAIVYFMTNQPMELERILKFTMIITLIALASEALGLAISSRLDIVNGIFVGPALSVPFMLLASYSFGIGSQKVPTWIWIGMQSSYLRFGIQGLVVAIYGDGRQSMVCPKEEMYCPFKAPRALLKEIGMENSDYWSAAGLLFLYLILFKLICYLILRKRLRRERSTGLAFVITRFVKSHFNLAHY